MNTKHSRTSLVLLAIAIFLLSLNLRPAIAVIGPMIQSVMHFSNINSIGIALLTTLPLLMMGFGAIFAGKIRQLLGERAGISIGGSIIILSCLLRFLSAYNSVLFLSAITVGLGIAIIQALLPGFIKRNYGNATSNMIALYSTGIVIGSAFAAGSASYFEDHLGWIGTLVIWSIPAFIALLIWIFSSKQSQHELAVKIKHPSVASLPYWKIGRSWSLLLFFGIGTGAFMLAMAWISPFFISLGVQKSDAGLLLSVLTIVEAITALILSVIIRHFPDRRALLIISLLLVSIGYFLLLMTPLSAPYFTVSLLGVGIGILFPLSIVIAMDHLNDPTQAGNFTAFVQGGGFIIASFIPLLAGGLHEFFADFSYIWWIMMLTSLMMILLVVRFSPKSYYKFQQQCSGYAKDDAL